MWRGTQYRSRLEARWAVFFSLLRWAAEYEPLDLSGYIPDFLLRRARRAPVAVECKPFLDLDDAGVPGFCETVDAAWRGEAMLVGLAPDRERGDRVVALGWRRGPEPNPDVQPIWSIGYLARGDEGGWTVGSEPAVLDAAARYEVSMLWGEACNESQWRPPTVEEK